MDSDGIETEMETIFNNLTESKAINIRDDYGTGYRINSHRPPPRQYIFTRQKNENEKLKLLRNAFGLELDLFVNFINKKYFPLYQSRLGEYYEYLNFIDQNYQNYPNINNEVYNSFEKLVEFIQDVFVVRQKGDFSDFLREFNVKKEFNTRVNRIEQILWDYKDVERKKSKKEQHNDYYYM
jgi:hypothetical protein